MKKFREDFFYRANDPGFGVVTVEKRTDKMIHVVNEHGTRWRMRIRTDKDGNEYATDSQVPKKYRDSLTYRAENEG